MDVFTPKANGISTDVNIHRKNFAGIFSSKFLDDSRTQPFFQLFPSLEKMKKIYYKRCVNRELVRLIQVKRG